MTTWLYLWRDYVIWIGAALGAGILWSLRRALASSRDVNVVSNRVRQVETTLAKYEALAGAQEHTLQSQSIEIKVLTERFAERTQAIDRRLFAICEAVDRIEKVLLERRDLWR